MTETTATHEKFESWGMLELMGRTKLAGKISEQIIGGCHFIRIDVPAITDLPGYTRFFTQAAIYGLTPTSENVARAVAASLRSEPVHAWDMRAAAQGALTFAGSDSPSGRGGDDVDLPF